MTRTPEGWEVQPLGDAAETSLGKMLDKAKDRGRTRVPYLRNVNVQWGRIDTKDLLTVELDEAERPRFEVRVGDLLVCEGGEVGRAALWRGGIEYVAYQKALHRVRPKPGLDANFLRYQLEYLAGTGALDQFTTGTTIRHLPQQQLRRVPLVLPQWRAQRRIVEILEDHLSRLDAGEAGVRTCAQRLKVWREHVVRDALIGRREVGPRAPMNLTDVGTNDGELETLPVGWQWARLGEVAEVVGGITKDVKKQSDPTFVEVPYLRVANVQRGRLDLSTVTHIRAPQAKIEALALRPGDVLLNEGGDRDKLARGWVWEGQIDRCIHQNHVFRARVRDSRLNPYFVSWVTNTIGGAWAERNGKQSVNLASISLSKIKLMPVIVPPPGRADEIVRDLSGVIVGADLLREGLDGALARSAALRRALLRAAFEGQLTGRAPDADVIEELAQ